MLTFVCLPGCYKRCSVSILLCHLQQHRLAGICTCTRRFSSSETDPHHQQACNSARDRILAAVIGQCSNSNPAGMLGGGTGTLVAVLA